MTNELICQVCNNSSKRDETFYILSVEVKNKKSVIESLNMYVSGEKLEGDNQVTCNICTRKVDSIKRCYISSLPNYLILHLKRFEFDLDTMRKIKLNDYCEFPMNINMKPYTKEGLSAAASGYYYYCRW